MQNFVLTNTINGKKNFIPNIKFLFPWSKFSKKSTEIQLESQLVKLTQS